MQMRRSLALVAMLASLAACGGEDVPMGEPAGMGAGRPDTTGAESGVLGEVEPDAEEVLDGMDVMPMGTQQDTNEVPAGAPR
jgi:hypothetical protein